MNDTLGFSTVRSLNIQSTPQLAASSKFERFRERLGFPKNKIGTSSVQDLFNSYAKSVDDLRDLIGPLTRSLAALSNELTTPNTAGAEAYANMCQQWQQYHQEELDTTLLSLKKIIACIGDLRSFETSYSKQFGRVVRYRRKLEKKQRQGRQTTKLEAELRYRSDMLEVTGSTLFKQSHELYRHTVEILLKVQEENAMRMTKYSETIKQLASVLPGSPGQSDLENVFPEFREDALESRGSKLLGSSEYAFPSAQTLTPIPRSPVQEAQIQDLLSELTLDDHWGETRPLSMA